MGNNPHFFYININEGKKLDSKQIIEAFTLLSKDKNVEKTYLSSIIEDIFKSMLLKKYGEEIEFIDNLENYKEDLLSLGLSNNKANTIIEINKLVSTKKIDLSRISTYEEKEAKDILCKIKGIGPWTVENFLIFSGNNTDICPANDLGLKKGIKIIYKLKDLPSDEEVYKIAEKWRPYRSIASRYIWEVVDQKINLT